MFIHSRPFLIEDFAACSAFLEATYLLNHGLHNWSLRHWEGQRYHQESLTSFPNSPIQIWAHEDKLVGFVHAEYVGSAFIQIHPQYRQLESEMLDWAESNLVIESEGHKKLELWAYENDTMRQDLLKFAAYERQDFHMNQRHCDLAQNIVAAPIAEGYQIRGMQRTMADCEQMANLLNAAFGRDFHKAQEYAHFQTAPHYRPELDLVAVAPDGKIAANAQVTVIETCDYAEFEPVCTHPEHQRKGLARSLMAEGLRMLQARDISCAFVDAAGDNPASNALYEQMGFTSVQELYLWQKIWD